MKSMFYFEKHSKKAYIDHDKMILCLVAADASVFNILRPFLLELAREVLLCLLYFFSRKHFGQLLFDFLSFILFSCVM